MFREAGTADLWALTELERESNQTALRHVFPPERFPFPDDDVLARWALVLEDPGAAVLVRDDPDRDGHLDVLAAYDDRSLRHLAVHPDRWGTGLASRAVAAALESMAARGTTVAELWCLELNDRARRRYEHLGWRATAERRPAPWPPHPTELRYTRPVPQGPLPGLRLGGG
jgi:GNAT superfamily N-acetyltransferase